MEANVMQGAMEHPEILLENQKNNSDDKRGDASSNTGQNSSNTNNVAGFRDPQINKHKKQSYASFFKDNRAPVESSRLKYIAPPPGEVVIGVEEIDSVEKSFGFCLVGYVMGPRPSPFAMLNFVKRWGGNVKFLFKDNGWIKFQFANELERDAVLNGGPYMILGKQLFLKKMPSCFLFSKEDMVFLPSWIQIFGLPADCWTAPALSRIASVVGKPIHTDQLTISKKGSTYARVLVEIDAKKPRVWEYKVKLPTGKTIVVKFKYELDPKFCNSCNSLGHTAESCGVDTRKKNSTYQRKQSGNNMTQDPAARLLPEDIKLDELHTQTMDVPECSSNKDCMEPKLQTQSQRDEDSTVLISNKGKTATTDIPASVEHHQDDFSDDDLLSGDGSARLLLSEEEYLLDSEDIDNILSPIQTQDQEEWKTVSKKNRRFKNRKKNAKNYTKAESGASSMETEYVKLDPITGQPLKGENSRMFKKNNSEARRPDTASGDK